MPDENRRTRVVAAESAMSNLPNILTPYSSAAERNSQPIFEQLQQLLPDTACVLEIGSGTGQHAVYFCRKLPRLTWQPSDRQENLPGLKQQFSEAGIDRILAPLALDVLQDQWPSGPYDAAYSANTSHIMPWEGVQATFKGLATVLAAGAYFYLYGPFNINGEFTAASNQAFDQALQAGEGNMGLRDIRDIEKLAASHQFSFETKIAMPANNFILVFRKI
jgi:hypothetical protein